MVLVMAFRFLLAAGTTVHDCGFFFTNASSRSGTASTIVPMPSPNEDEASSPWPWP